MLTSRRVDVERSPIPIKSSAGIAQLVERNLAKVEVASSNLVSRSILLTPNIARSTARARPNPPRYLSRRA